MLLSIYLFLSLGVSFLCSLFEAVVLSITPTYTESLIQGGHRSGELIRRLRENIEDSLAAILTLNTIAHTIGAAGVGAEVLKLYGDRYVAVGSAILTLLVLVLSEIIPKTLGASHWQRLAPFVAHGIRFFILITYPFVRIFKRLAALIGGSSEGPQFTRDEIQMAAELGRREGNLSEQELDVIRNLLKLRDVTVHEILTPRTVVFAFEETSTISEVIDNNAALRFSRIPTYQGTVDEISGLVSRYEILEAKAEGRGGLRLVELKKPIHRVPESMRVWLAIETFVERGEHLFAVVDEYGGFTGIVTLEDCLETLLGLEIVDEYDSVEDMRKHAQEIWAKRKAKRAAK